jgi:hypothetical protein
MPRRILAALRHKPSLGAVRIGHGLNRGEGFGGDEEECALRLDLLERSGQLMAIDVGDEMKAFTCGGKGLQRQHRHLRAQVRAANADVNHIGDLRVAAYLLSVGEHGVQSGMHLVQFACICYIFSSCSRDI